LKCRDPIDKETNRIIEYVKEMENAFSNHKKEMYAMKRRELERINKEFLVKCYQRKYNITQDVIVSVIVGEDHVNSEMGRQYKEQKVKY
jgi:hypothetical protein